MVIGFVILNVTLSNPEYEPNLISNHLNEYYHTNLHILIEEHKKIKNLFLVMQVACVLLYTHLIAKFAFPEAKNFLFYLQLDITFLFIAFLIVILLLSSKVKFYTSNNYQEIDYGRILDLKVFYLYVFSCTVQLWHFIVFVLIANIKILDDWLVCGTFVVNTGFVVYALLTGFKMRESNKFKTKIKFYLWEFIGYFVFVYIIIYIYVAGFRFTFPKKITLSGFCILRSLAVLAFLSPSIALALNYEETIGLFEKIKQYYEKTIEFLEKK